MMRNSGSGLSRRKFLIASSAADLVGLTGYMENNTDGGGSGGDSEGGDSSGDGNNEPPGTIDTIGPSTVFSLVTAMAERFQTGHSEINISLQSTDSSGGFANYFCTGQTDFSDASRPVKDEEQDRCESNDVTPIKLKTVTNTPTVVVNDNNDLLGEGFTIEQLQTILSAESTPATQSDVNSKWPDKETETYGLTNASGTYDYLIEAIIGEESPGHRQDYSTTERDCAIVQGVEGSEYTIGYLGFAYYSKNTDVVQAIPIENGTDEFIEPSLDTASSGEYNPLSRPLFTYPAHESLAEEHAAEFARYWIENSTSREIVADEVGYIPLDKGNQQEVLDTPNAVIKGTN